MAMPDNRLSSQVMAAALLSPDDLRISNNLLVDYERGGIAVNDASAGLDYQNWELRYDNPTVFVIAEFDPTHIDLFTWPTEIARLSLAFDQNMHPAITFEESSGATYLWWYDPFPGVQAQVFLQIPDAINACVCMDDKRMQLISTSDVLLAYQKADGGLYYRQQRDRYTIERLLAEDTLGQILFRTGMTRNGRVLFEFYTSSEA